MGSKGVQRAMQQFHRTSGRNADRPTENDSGHGGGGGMRRLPSASQQQPSHSPCPSPTESSVDDDNGAPQHYLTSNGHNDSTARSSSRRRPRRSPAPSPNRYNNETSNSIIMNGTFQKILILLFIIVIFDTMYVWDYFDNIDDMNADGPEAGMHHLHESRRKTNIIQKIKEGIQAGEKVVEDEIHMVEKAIEGGDTSTKDDDVDDDKFGISNFDSLPDSEKITQLEHSVLEWRGQYEKAMAKLGQNPYTEGFHVQNMVTPIPPNKMNDDYKPKKSRAELEGMDTFGVDEQIVKILHSASVEIDKELAEQLPTWDDVVEMYGPSPIIHGLHTCERYREMVKPQDRMTGPAGMFNTGTNLLFALMKVNCNIKEARKVHREPRRNGMRWQVPWGKHNPPTTHRFKNVAKAWGEGIKQDDFMPVVLIKDPYTWMGSQCRHKYTTFWGHDDKHCPNLIRWKVTDKDEPSVVRVKFALQMKMYESLLDMWNKWYEEWEEQLFPHLTTRFEDLLFHGEEVTRMACDCVGGEFTKEFEYVEDSAKPERGVHKGANGLVKAMLQYGNPNKRLEGFTVRDRIYASKTVDTNLMKRYGYPAPNLPTSEEIDEDRAMLVQGPI